MNMMKKVEKQKLPRLIRQSLRSLCEAGLPESTNITIEGLIGITVNSEYVVLVNIQEEIGEGDADMINCSMHEEPSHVERLGRGKSSPGFHGHGQGMNMKMMRHHHMMRRHMMHAVHVQMPPAAAASPRSSNSNPLPNQHQGGQFPKRTSPQQSKQNKHNFEFEPYEVEDDISTSQVPPSFPMASSSPCKSLNNSSQDGKADFPFVNYDREMYPAEDTQAQTETHEPSPEENPPKSPLAAKPMSADEVQASTICITPVIDSPKSDEPTPSTGTEPSASVTEMTNQMSALSEFGRKLGTLMAVKQEGASLKRGAKTHTPALSSPLVEEISDSDNTTQGDERTSMDQDPVMGGAPETSSPTAEVEAQALAEDGPSKHLGMQDPNANANDCINMDIEILAHMDGDEHPHDFVDLDHSFLQILPEVVDKHPEMINDFVEMDNDEVKGEPKEKKEPESGTQSTHGSDGEEATASDKKESIRKKIACKLAAGSEQEEEFEDGVEVYPGNIEDADQLPEDYYETAEGFMPPGGMPFPPGPPPFMGRGFGPRGGFCGRRGGMYGRGFFGRGGPMMTFAGHPFFRFGDGEKKLLRCNICGSCFINKANYETHMLKHENKGQGSSGLSDDVGTPCPYCKKRFRYKSWLEQHITAHTKEKLFRCPYCSKAYTRRRNVHKHIEMFHPEILGQQPVDEGLVVPESVNLDS